VADSRARERERLTVRYKNEVSLGDRAMEHMTRVHMREDRERGARAWLATMTELANRVAAAHDAIVPDDLRRTMRGRKLAEDAFAEAAAYFLEPLHDKRPELAARGYELFWSLMAGSFLIGAAATMSPSAQRKVERTLKALSIARGSDGGKKGAITKKAKAEARPWRKAARRILEGIIAKGGRKWSKLALVSEIKSRWTDDMGVLPGDRTISRLIDEMRREGKKI
jgi:hypothetical protein